MLGSWTLDKVTLDCILFIAGWAPALPSPVGFRGLNLQLWLMAPNKMKQKPLLLHFFPLKAGWGVFSFSTVQRSRFIQLGPQEAAS